MKRIITIVVLVAASVAGIAQTNWKIDNSHATFGFTVTHLVVSEVQGNFKKFSGTVTTKGDDFTTAEIQMTADANSVNTNNEMRDNHLKGDDFFNAEKFPQLTFKSTSFKQADGKKWVLEGDLTIRDVTKRVKFDVINNGIVKSPSGKSVAGFQATTTINRFDYNLKWNKLAEAGAVVDKDVKITINLELIKDL